MANSLFKDYNYNHQLAADIYYYFDFKINKLSRKVNLRELPSNIYCQIDIQKIINNL